MKKLIILFIIIAVVTSSCINHQVESDVTKIIPYNEEKIHEEIVQIYLPNKNLSCVVMELTRIKGITKETYLERTLERAVKRSLESNSFIDMNVLNIIKSDIVDKTAFITIEWENDLYMNEEDECLLLYSLINTASSMKEIEFVKIINNSKDYFHTKFEINEALSPSNTILYKDYIKPINSIDDLLGDFFKNRNVFALSSEETKKYLDENLSQFIGYNVRDYYYNQYNNLLTITASISFYNESYIRTEEKLNFLLEYKSGTFKVREIYKEEDAQ